MVLQVKQFVMLTFIDLWLAWTRLFNFSIYEVKKNITKTFQSEVYNNTTI